MDTQKETKIPWFYCETMILDVIKASSKKAISTDIIMSEIEKKYSYSQQAPIKKALKQLLADNIFVNSILLTLNDD